MKRQYIMPIMQAMNVTLKTAIMSSPDDGQRVTDAPEGGAGGGSYSPTRIFR